MLTGISEAAKVDTNINNSLVHRPKMCSFKTFSYKQK